jgi:hypothetical protein
MLGMDLGGLLLLERASKDVAGFREISWERHK